jgi:hypothetical protein
VQLELRVVKTIFVRTPRDEVLLLLLALVHPPTGAALRSERQDGTRPSVAGLAAVEALGSDAPLPDVEVAAALSGPLPAVPSGSAGGTGASDAAATDAMDALLASLLCAPRREEAAAAMAPLPPAASRPLRLPKEAARAAGVACDLAPRLLALAASLLHRGASLPEGSEDGREPAAAPSADGFADVSAAAGVLAIAALWTDCSHPVLEEGSAAVETAAMEVLSSDRAVNYHPDWHPHANHVGKDSHESIRPIYKLMRVDGQE